MARPRHLDTQNAAKGPRKGGRKVNTKMAPILSSPAGVQNEALGAAKGLPSSVHAKGWDCNSLRFFVVRRGGGPKPYCTFGTSRLHPVWPWITCNATKVNLNAMGSKHSFTSQTDRSFKALSHFNALYHFNV